MNTIILLTTLALGLSESIETRLPQDPGMIYTVGFTHEGIHVGLDWKNRQIVPERVCRKASLALRPQCQEAALSWLRQECAWYGDKNTLSVKEEEMQTAVCSGAQALGKLVTQRQIADR